MNSISALTFYRDRQTTARRASAVPQLTCEGRQCRTFQPQVVQCVAMGGNGGNGLEWKCDADLPNSVRFGNVEVSCEGWNNANDPYILKVSSCALQIPALDPQAEGELTECLGCGQFEGILWLDVQLGPLIDCLRE